MNDVSGAQTLSSNEGMNTRLSSSPPKSCTSCSSSTPNHKKGKSPFFFSPSFLVSMNCCILQFLFCLFICFQQTSRLGRLYSDFTLLCSNAVLLIMVAEFDQRSGGVCKEAERVGVVGPC